MFPIWIIYISVAGISSVIFNFINRHVLKDGDDSTSYAWWFEVLRTLLFLPFCFFGNLPQLNSVNIILFIAIGVTEFFGVYIYMKMHSKSELSISTIVSQMRIVWIPVMAFVFLGEKLLFKEYVGIILVFVGQGAIALRGKIKLDKGIKYALLSSIFVAINSVLAKKGAPVFEAPIIVLAMGLPAILFFPMLMKNAKYRIRNFGSTKWKKIVTAVLFNAVTMLFMIWALKFGSVGKVIGVFQGMTVLGVLVGILFLHEKGNLGNKILGSLVVLIGIFLLV